MNLQFGITQKFTLAFVLFAFFLLSGMIFVVRFNGRNALQATVQSELLAKASDEQLALNNWVNDRLSLVMVLAQNPSIVEMVEIFTATPPGTPEAQATQSRLQRELMPNVELNDSILSLFILEPEQAQVIVSTSPADEGKYQETMSYFVDGKVAPYIQNVYYSSVLQAPAMSVVAPLHAEDGRLLGVLVGRLNLEKLNMIMQQRTGLRQTDDTFLINSSNQFVTIPRFSPESAVLRSGIHTEAVTRCLTHENGITSAPDYRNIPAIITYRWLPEREVCLIVKMDQAEAFASITSFDEALGFLVLIVLSFASFVAVVLARSLTKGLRSLTLGAAKIGQGHLDTQIDVKSKDELGQLARSFNEMAANLRQSRESLETANKELEAFSYSVSHDLRAPLRALDGFSRILIEDFSADLPSDAKRYLDLVRSNAQKMGQLVDDLLAFSRLGRQSLNKQTVAPADLARQALADLNPDQENRKIEIVIGDLPACQGDPALLKQVFINLLANAIKFTGIRDMAKIEVGYLPPQPPPQPNAVDSDEEAAAGTEPGKTVYFVRDNGVGFDMRYADKLFGVFQRLHKAEDFEGTGVGLAIVQRIIIRHGGRVWVEAAVDQGATFYFSL